MCRLVSSVVLLLACTALTAAEPPNARRPKDDADLKYWLQNMVWHHRFRTIEIAAATGLTCEEIATALKRFDVRPDNRPQRPTDAPLLVLPYPGGRHPRLGFLDGAVRPQRETKVSVFTPGRRTAMSWPTCPRPSGVSTACSAWRTATSRDGGGPRRRAAGRPVGSRAREDRAAASIVHRLGPQRRDQPGLPELSGGFPGPPPESLTAGRLIARCIHGRAPALLVR